MQPFTVVNDVSFLSSVGKFSSADLSIFREHSHDRIFRKGEIILEAGAVLHSLYFLRDGAAVEYRESEEKDRSYSGLFISNDWLIAHDSLVQQSPSETIIEAYADCSAVEVSLYSLHQLITLSPSFFQIGKLLGCATDRIKLLTIKEPAKRYTAFLESRRKAMNAFPLKVIASYLGMTPETLSRIRGNYK